MFQIPVPTLQPRCGHSAGAYSLSPGLTEVVIFGGDNGCCILANTLIMRFGEFSKRKFNFIRILEKIFLHKICAKISFTENTE